MSGGEDKTEKPTPRKLREARREGRVARSADLGAWAVVLAAAWLLPHTLRAGVPRLQALLEQIPQVIAEPTAARATAMVGSGARTLAVLTLPLCLGLAVVSVLANAVQGGIHLATKNLKPQWKRLNPQAGLKRIAGPHAAWEAGKTLVKTAVTGLIAYHLVRGTAVTLTARGAQPLGAVLATAVDTAVRLVREVAAAGLLMGVADYAYQRRRVNKQLRMTKHEVKQEHKQTEGDPHIKGAIRSRQLAMSRNRMMARIAEADVVVVNPTHVAVALSYRPDRGAPRVVAKGADHLAARIRERAAAHRVPMVTDVPLARALYASGELDREIPTELFTAVARVLAFVLALRARGSAAGTHRLAGLPRAHPSGTGTAGR
jgi:flagellar biosynthetic protein FlhB